MKNKSKGLSAVASVDVRSIKECIHIVRGVQVILDFDLAALYGYSTKDFNRQVKNNIEKFDADFMFLLTADEVENLRCKIFTSRWGGSRYLPRRQRMGVRYDHRASFGQIDLSDSR